MPTRNLKQKPGFSAGTPLTRVNYVYNIRGRLFSTNNPYADTSTKSDQVFGMEPGHDQNASLGTCTPQYNGNKPNFSPHLNLRKLRN